MHVHNHPDGPPLLNVLPLRSRLGQGVIFTTPRCLLHDLPELQIPLGGDRLDSSLSNIPFRISDATSRPRPGRAESRKVPNPRCRAKALTSYRGPCANPPPSPFSTKYQSLKHLNTSKPQFIKPHRHRSQTCCDSFMTDVPPASSLTLVVQKTRLFVADPFPGSRLRFSTPSSSNRRRQASNS
jgi:hypothetical protein